MRERPWIAAYIVTNKPYGTLYVGVTSNLWQRMEQHREGTFPGFTAKRGLGRLVWHETFESMVEAIQREKSLKRYLRDWKINLIERDNPHWVDLHEEMMRTPVLKPGLLKEP